MNTVPSCPYAKISENDGITTIRFENWDNSTSHTVCIDQPNRIDRIECCVRHGEEKTTFYFKRMPTPEETREANREATNTFLAISCLGLVTGLGLFAVTIIGNRNVPSVRLV